MDEVSDLLVPFGPKEVSLSCRLVIKGFTHKFIVPVEGIELTFEKDEDGNYRVMNFDEDTKREIC